jgi:predicted transcriptional regulator of viral defense system
MPKIFYPERLDILVAVGEGQDGYFTTEQARDAGLSLHALGSLEQAGHLKREQYGVYRLVRWPPSNRPGLWRAFLWATRIDRRAAFSHRTALELHGISDINPSKIDVTLPRGARVRSTTPPAVVAHRRDLPEKQVEDRDGLRVTTLYRTLMDLATDRLALVAVADALDRGNEINLSSEQLRQLRAIYDLSDETRQYLARSFSSPRRLPGKR